MENNQAPMSANKRRVKAAIPNHTRKGSAPMRRTLTPLELQFCQVYVEVQKQAEAYRVVRPEAKNPHTSANRIMARPEVRAHINAIFKLVAKKQDKAADTAAKAAMLSLEMRSPAFAVSPTASNAQFFKAAERIYRNIATIKSSDTASSRQVDGC